jgi:alkanesulfonate monooxygenase SsuD/methylene tetrahydromethanopterin reductase-like flavin-dependent oxidoreductase (luciferase family)
VALAAEIADGWLPLYYSPFRQEVYAASLGDLRPDFEIAQMVIANVTDDVEAGLMPVKSMLGFYIGGMGAKKRNFHKELMAKERVRERLEAWRETPVTTLLVPTGDPDTLRTMAELVL